MPVNPLLQGTFMAANTIKPVRCATRKSTEHGPELGFNSLHAQRPRKALPSIMTTPPIRAAISNALPCSNCEGFLIVTSLIEA